MADTSSRVPGLGLVLLLALVATAFGRMFPLIGGAVMGMMLGVALRWRFPLQARFVSGIQFASRQLLQWSIVLLGLCLPIAEVVRTGLHSLSVTLMTIGAAYVSTFCFGKLLGIPPKLCTLIGTGTAICGGSAIAAVIPVLQPDDHEAAYSLSTIFLFNIVAVLLFPLCGHLLGLSDQGFGLWAGTAINDTSSVVAAGYAWSKDAGEYATIVKLTRALLIIPVTLIIGFMFRTRHTSSHSAGIVKLGRTVPWFIIWFAIASVAGGFLPAIASQYAHWLAPFLITAALTAIGISIDLAKMRQTGWRPLVLGMLVWISVAACSLLVQRVQGLW